MRTGLETGATTRRRSWMQLIAVVCIGLLLSQFASGAAINYGNFGPVPPGVSFLSVTESSGTDPVPMYGPPTAFTTGLSFTPSNFVSSSTGGASDITDGQLNFTIVGSPNNSINNISLFEAGDYSLVGTGTTLTSVFAGAIIRATVTEINGVAVAPINLAPANGAVGFDLISDAGVVQPWALGTILNIASQLSVGQNATRVDISINNQLISLSEQASAAFIAKKTFQLDVATAPVPEPSSIGLSVLLLSFGLGARRRRLVTDRV
jgi:hypothetical protein